MDQLSIIMMVIWGVAIIAALVIEYLTHEFVSLWFAPAGLVALILAAVGVHVWIQIVVFIVLSFGFMLACRPLLKKFVIKPTVKTDIMDVNLGIQTRLKADTEDGQSEIEINGVIWTVKLDCRTAAPEGTMVETVSKDGNKFLVKIVAP